MNTTEETREIDIPQSALTTCPARQFVLVSIARRCIGCPFHQGFMDTDPNGDAPFNVRYRVNCGVPQQREIFIADTGE